MEYAGRPGGSRKQEYNKIYGNMEEHPGMSRHIQEYRGEAGNIQESPGNIKAYYGIIVE